MNKYEESRECRDEKLIEIVKSIPALWDSRVSLHQRTKTKKKLLWEQVEKAMEGLITAEEASKRWKYLKDCFTRYKRESSFPRRPKEFRFSEMMSFLEADISTVNDLSKGYLSGVSEEQDELYLNIPMLTSTPNKTDSSKDAGIRHFANFLIEGMTKLPQKQCRKLQMQMLQLLAKAEEEKEEEEKENTTA